MSWRMRARHRLREPETAVDRASDEEIVALLGGCCSARDRLIVLLMARAGLRRGELCGLRRSDVHLLLDSRPLGCETGRAHLHVGSLAGADEEPSLDSRSTSLLAVRVRKLSVLSAASRAGCSGDAIGNRARARQAGSVHHQLVVTNGPPGEVGHLWYSLLVLGRCRKPAVAQRPRD